MFTFTIDATFKWVSDMKGIMLQITASATLTNKQVLGLHNEKSIHFFFGKVNVI